MDPQSHSPERIDKKPQIIKTLIKFIPQWGQFPAEQIQLERMTGMTNETYKVSHPKIKTALIYRQFGDATDNIFLNREVQEFVYKFISDQKVGPKIFGMTEDVRIQEFIPSKVLKTKQMLEPQYVENIAFALRRFHQIVPKGQQLQKKSLFSKIFFGQNSQILKKCQSKMAKPIFTPEQTQILKELQKWVCKQEIQFLKKVAEPLQACRLVFSHNDLLAGNVLVRQGDNKIIFIDYEYSCYNYRVYDIANYFNECVYDYEVKQTPFFKILKMTKRDQQMKEKFIKCYALAEQNNYKLYKDKVQKAQLSENAKRIYDQVKRNLMVAEMLSHVMWGFWAIIVSKNPQIDFDYLKFSKVRHNFYQELKKQYLKQHHGK